MADYDLLGNIAIIKSESDGEKKNSRRKLEESKFLLRLGGVESVYEKASNVRGRLRTVKLKHISGKKSLIANYKENGCRFRFDISTCYFSPRLSNDRKEVAKKIRKKDSVLVMFAGVGAYPIVINKFSRPKRIVGVEIGRDCCRWFKKNLELNKMGNIEVIQGDVKKKVGKKLGKFDVIMMARPNLEESFLKYALEVSKKGSRIFYHAFCREDELGNYAEELKKEARECKRKIKIKEIIKAGEIAPYKFRYRIEILV
jgi:tRNA (guanine37-N1)-methyltransferase